MNKSRRRRPNSTRTLAATSSSVEKAMTRSNSVEQLHVSLAKLSLRDGFSSGFADFGEIVRRPIATSGAAAWITINRLVSKGLEKGHRGLGLLFIDRYGYL